MVATAYLLPHSLRPVYDRGVLDPGRTVAELRELRELTGDENGAQRVAWTDTWEQARDLDHAHTRFSGARRTTSFSTSTITRKNEMPSAAATTFVAQSPRGSVE